MFCVHFGNLFGEVRVIACAILLAVFLNAKDVSCDNSGPIFNCQDLQPQNAIALDQLMGMWYGVEVVQHRSDRSPPGYLVTHACPILHLSMPTQSLLSKSGLYGTSGSSGNVELNLLWKEEAGTVEYTFMIPKPNNPGFWMSKGHQNGTVQVLKVVDDHMVLTFCSPNTQLYTVILSRTTSLDLGVLRSVRKMLIRKTLPEYSIKQTNCNSAHSISSSVNYCLLSIMFIMYFFYR